MALAVAALAVAVQLYWLVLFGRLVLELVMMISRTWRPSGAWAVAAEVLFSLTDPPLKLVRRMIPPVRIGGGGFDLGFVVVMLAVGLLSGMLQWLAAVLAR